MAVFVGLMSRLVVLEREVRGVPPLIERLLLKVVGEVSIHMTTKSLVTDLMSRLAMNPASLVSSGVSTDVRRF